VPLDKPNTLSGKRAAAHSYADPQTGREVRLVADHPMLYDLRLDPGESYNVVDRHPDVAAQVLGDVERWEQEYFANPRGWK
jgi:hypothetical protein